MKKSFRVSFTYAETVIVQADTHEEAENLALDYLKDAGMPEHVGTEIEETESEGDE